MMADGKSASAPEDVAVRRMGPDQWAVCREVRLAALADAPYAFSSTLEREQGFDEQVWRQRLASAATFLAWRDGEPAGIATGLADDLGDRYGFPGWQLVGMWVHPRARGLGIADMLIETVADHARAHGAASLVLWVTEVNARAQAFYRRMGFRRTGVRGLVRPDEPDHWEELLVRDLS